MSETRKPIPAFYIGIVMFAAGLLVSTLLLKGPFSGSATTDDTPSSQPNQASLKLNGKVVADDALPYVFAAEITELNNRASERRVQILRQAGLELHLNALAREQGKTLAEVTEGLIGPINITEEETNQFYNENESRIGRPFYEVKEAIENALRQDKLASQREELTKGLEKQGILTVSQPTFSAPVASFDLSNLPSAGSEKAPVTIVEFADYRCSHCKKASHTLKEVVEAHPEQVRWVMLDFPLLGGQSRQLAIGAYCAGEQNRFWDYHHALFAAQDSLTKDSVNTIAADLGLDTTKFEACVTGDAAADRVDLSQKMGMSVGVKGTPAIFINGLAYTTGNLEDDLKQTIEQAIASKRQH